MRGEIRIEFGLRYRGDLATAPMSHRAALVAACRACVYYLTDVQCMLLVCVHVCACVRVCAVPSLSCESW